MKRIEVPEQGEGTGSVRDYRPLVEDDAYYVLVSHAELDNLIANLMHLAELDSDKEHREALKGELKVRSRKWLDELYSDSGYTNYRLHEGIKPFELKR